MVLTETRRSSFLGIQGNLLTVSRCCGTHLPSLHDLQLYILPNVESVSRTNTAGGSTTTARIFFLAGPRLLQHLNTSHVEITQASNLLSCAPASVVDRTKQVLEDRRLLDKRVNALEAELAQRLADMHITMLKSGSPVRHEHRVDDSTGALAFLGLIAAQVATNAEPELDYLLVLSSCSSAQSQSSTSVIVVVGSDEARVKAVGNGLKTKLAVKGGGKGTRWSGKFTGVFKDSKEGSIIRELIT
jgi:misacylated tRNA(Ala) deacylase